jgi:hypothetical protein
MQRRKGPYVLGYLLVPLGVLGVSAAALADDGAGGAQPGAGENPSAAAPSGEADSSEAAAPATDEAPLPAPPRLLRSGFSAGVAGGLLLSAAHGFPNDVEKIGVAQYEAGTGLGVSSGGSLWLGGAVADWLSLGVGFTAGSNRANHTRSSGGSLEVRVEAFPLYDRGSAWQDLGFLFCAGTGSYTIKRDGESVAQGQGTSAIGLGLFYERWRLGHFAFGPELEYQHQFSRSLTLQSLVIGVRAAFYAGPSANPAP